MRRSDMARRRSPLPFLIAIAAVIVIVGAAVLLFEKASTNSREMDAESYYGLTSAEQAALVINDTILEKKGIVRDGAIYIDYPTVWNNLNSNFYWEADTKQMLLTLPEGTVSWKVGEGDDSLIEIDGVPYLSAACIQANSDIDMSILTNPHRIIARTSWNNLTAEKVIAETAVRNRADKKGEILTHVKPGDVVVLVENAGNWCKVATSDGFSGYLQRSEFEAAPEGAISHVSDEKFVFQHILRDVKVCMGWQYMESKEDRELQALITRTNGMNTISPTWFRFISNTGDLESLATSEYGELAHAQGLQVWGCLQDVFGSSYNAGEVLTTYEARAHVIKQLMDAADLSGMDGINIDIETIEQNTAPQYLQFLRELSVAAHEKGLIVSTDTYVPIYTQYYNRKEQARTVDYIVLMGYDEHTVGSSEAGSVASLPFVEQGILDALEEVPAEQLVNGIPFYTRGWTTVYGEGRPQSQAFGMNDADAWADAHGISLYWDSEVGQNVGSSEDGNARYSIWMEDEKSIEEKMKLIERYNLAGVACWRLGLERSGVWNIISKYVQS